MLWDALIVQHVSSDPPYGWEEESLYYHPHRIIERCKKESFLKPDTRGKTVPEVPAMPGKGPHNQHLGDKEKCASGIY